MDTRLVDPLDLDDLLAAADADAGVPPSAE
jgi:hypothetical protein